MVASFVNFHPPIDLFKKNPEIVVHRGRQDLFKLSECRKRSIPLRVLAEANDSCPEMQCHMFRQQNLSLIIIKSGVPGFYSVHYDRGEPCHSA